MKSGFNPFAATAKWIEDILIVVVESVVAKMSLSQYLHDPKLLYSYENQNAACSDGILQILMILI